MTIAILSTSLRPHSHSRTLALSLRELLTSDPAEPAVEFIDLREFELPHCDGGAAYGAPDVQRLAGLLKQTQVIICATPIYNFDVNSALKNAIELTGRDCWSGKVVGFLCAAGGAMSYMSIMAVANSLMLDFRTVIIPRFVFTDGSAFDDSGALVDEAILERLVGLGKEAIRFAPLAAPSA